MTCNRKLCMICKHGIVGDRCKNKEFTYTLACSKDLLDRKTVYRLRTEHLQEELDKSINEDKTNKSKDIKKQLELKRKIKKAKEAINLLDKTHKEYYKDQHK